ncbi:hypothetical protein N499_0233B, partial [Wolbachia pipientis wVitA]
RSIYRRGVN